MSTAANYSTFMHCVPIKNIQNCIQDSILMSHQLSQQAKVGGGESLTAAEKDKARGNILKEYFQRV